MSTYCVGFTRVGRNHSVAPLTVESDDADDLAEQIHDYVRPHLGTRFPEVYVNLDKGTGFVLSGMHNAGDFTVTKLCPCGGDPVDGADRCPACLWDDVQDVIDDRKWEAFHEAGGHR